jgi:diguanylate cyclase (GGDEF)-like protein/PAS domain S-box-containing protein
MSITPDGVVVASNDAFARLVGTTSDALVERPLGSFCVDPGPINELLASAAAGGDGGEQLVGLRRTDVPPLPVTVAWSVVRDEQARPDYIVLVGAEASPVFLDVDEKAQQQQAFFDALNANASELAVVVDGNARVLFISPGVHHLLGWDVDSLLTQDSFGYVHPEDVGAAMDTFASVLAEGGTRNVLLRLRAADGSYRWLDTTATNLVATPIGGVVGNLRDVTDRVRAEDALKQSEEKYRAMAAEARQHAEELRHATLHDSLTGLPNRALLIDRLEHALSREGSRTALVMFDLDQFKLVNDAHGHQLGDAVLAGVAERLLEAVRPADTVARFVGDEFVVLLEDIDTADATAFAHDLLALLSQPIGLDGGLSVPVGASVGVAGGPVASAADLLRHAGDAMQAAKAAGRGRVRQFDRALGERSERGYALAAELAAALAHDDLTLAYQPVIDLSTGAVLGMEALARWSSPTFGEVPPAQFVATAEMSGMALELDRWVIRVAMAQLALLRAGGTVPLTAYVAINLSARSLADPVLEQIVSDAAAAAGLAPALVLLEITESAIMEDAATAIGILTRLRGRGFQIAIDDFGTGYSSLSYLRDLPITTLKIDRSFVAEITEDRDALAIAASIVDLARAVGVSVVAEGIETREQAALLRQLGCAAGQGWLWCRALPYDDVAAAGWTESREPAPQLVTTSATPPGRVIRREHGIDRLLAMHSEGASLATIASALNREGYRTPTGQRWHSATVARAITRSAYPTLEDGRTDR